MKCKSQTRSAYGPDTIYQSWLDLVQQDECMWNLHPVGNFLTADNIPSQPLIGQSQPWPTTFLVDHNPGWPFSLLAGYILAWSYFLVLAYSIGWQFNLQTICQLRWDRNGFKVWVTFDLYSWPYFFAQALLFLFNFFLNQGCFLVQVLLS